jgi:fatty-acyl-CoA synthase
MTEPFLQADHIAAMIAAEKPNLAGAVPTIFGDLLRHLDSHPTDTSSLKEVIIGGSVCPPALMHALSERHGIEVIHAWGMTETSPLGSVARPPAHLSRDEAWAYRYTQGRTPASVEARVVGPGRRRHAQRRQVRRRARGARAVGHRPLHRRRVEQPDPEKFRDGWLRTGDVGRLSPDGYLTLTDRAKDVIKSGGEWISSLELENFLMEHPAVAEACVVAVPDDKWGERPLASVVVNEGCHRDGRRAEGVPRPARWPAGSCPSAGHSSRPCRRRASASTTRRNCSRTTSDGALTVEEVALTRHLSFLVRLPGVPPVGSR